MSLFLIPWQQWHYFYFCLVLIVTLGPLVTAVSSLHRLVLTGFVRQSVLRLRISFKGLCHSDTREGWEVRPKKRAEIRVRRLIELECWMAIKSRTFWQGWRTLDYLVGKANRLWWRPLVVVYGTLRFVCFLLWTRERAGHVPGIK